jgi:hypothetical protein
MLDLELIDREFQHGQDIHVAGVDDIGDIAVNEDLTRIETKHIVGCHP